MKKLITQTQLDKATTKIKDGLAEMQASPIWYAEDIGKITEALGVLKAKVEALYLQSMIRQAIDNIGTN